jgi:hypothetical protein
MQNKSVRSKVLQLPGLLFSQTKNNAVPIFRMLQYGILKVLLRIFACIKKFQVVSNYVSPAFYSLLDIRSGINYGSTHFTSRGGAIQQRNLRYS